jgi:lipopolysaccharide export system protein LptA
MQIRADRHGTARDRPDGYRAATGHRQAGKPATYRQKRDGVDETVEGQADRIEYDGRAGTLRFVGNGVVRRLRGGTVADEITGPQILGQTRPSSSACRAAPPPPANPGGRVRAVITPACRPTPPRRRAAALKPAPGLGRPATGRR